MGQLCDSTLGVLNGHQPLTSRFETTNAKTHIKGVFLAEESHVEVDNMKHHKENQSSFRYVQSGNPNFDTYPCEFFGRPSVARAKDGADGRLRPADAGCGGTPLGCRCHLVSLSSGESGLGMASGGFRVVLELVWGWFRVVLGLVWGWFRVVLGMV